ncbi:MAG: PPK2 family polyphosphate kinase [Dermatophilaceae bacterium]
MAKKKDGKNKDAQTKDGKNHGKNGGKNYGKDRGKNHEKNQDGETQDAKSEHSDQTEAQAQEGRVVLTSVPTPPEPAGDEPSARARRAPGHDGLSDAIRTALRVRPGFQLADVDPGSTPGFEGGKNDAEKVMVQTADEVAELQERLYAEAKGRSEGGRSVLLLVQGMDTSGKGGIMRHVIGLMDPQGVKITAFKVPTPEERRHPFLWRIRRALPAPGQVGVFDRSQYEDVLVVRVHHLVAKSTWTRRYGQINTFERTTAHQGTSIVKVMLHIGRDEQRARLAERLARPDKHWKFNPGDIDERAQWDDYQVAYQAALERTSTDDAPWYVVPANEKWYARLAVQHILLGELRAMNPQWPPPDYDVAEQQARLAAT